MAEETNNVEEVEVELTEEQKEFNKKVNKAMLLKKEELAKLYIKWEENFRKLEIDKNTEINNLRNDYQTKTNNAKIQSENDSKNKNENLSKNVQELSKINAFYEMKYNEICGILDNYIEASVDLAKATNGLFTYSKNHLDVQYQDFIKAKGENK